MSYGEYLSKLLATGDDLPDAWVKLRDEWRTALDAGEVPKKASPSVTVTADEEQLEQKLLAVMTKLGRVQELHVDRLRESYRFFNDRPKPSKP